MGRNSQFPLSLSHKLPLFFPIIALTLFKCNSEISIKNLLYLSFVYYTLEIVKYVGRSNATNQISHWSTADNWKFYKIELQIVLSFDSCYICYSSIITIKTTRDCEYSIRHSTKIAFLKKQENFDQELFVLKTSFFRELFLVFLKESF